MRPNLPVLVSFIFVLSCQAHADQNIDLDHVKEASLREVIRHSLNFSSTSPILMDDPRDQATQIIRVTRLLQASGYLDATTQQDLGSDGATRISPRPGEIYDLGYVAVEGLPGTSENALHEKLQLRTARYVGAPARADSLFNIKRDVLNVLEENGFATPVISKVEYHKNAPTHLVGMQIFLEAGPQAEFGDIIFKESPSIELASAAHLSGRPYHPETIDNLRKEIQELGLFRRISLSVQPREGNSAIVDIYADLRRNNKTGNELAGHGLVGLGVLLTCCAMLGFRQVSMMTTEGTRNKAGRMLDITIVAVLLASAIFALDRIAFLIG